MNYTRYNEQNEYSRTFGDFQGDILWDSSILYGQLEGVISIEVGYGRVTAAGPEW